MNIEQRYPQEFSILREQGQLSGDWSNVYEHCKLEAEIAELLSDMIGLSIEDTDILIRSAILHDWYKKIERTTENYDTAYSEKGLQELGIPQRIIDVAHSVGHSTLVWIEQSDLLRKLMHFIDDIVSNTTITEIAERVDTMQAKGHLLQLEEDMRSVLDGRSFFDVQKEVGIRIQNEIEDLCHIEHGTLVNIIKQKLQR